MTISLTTLPVVQPSDHLKGSPSFEKKRTEALEVFASKVPPELRLPPKLIQNPPTDVSSIPGTCGILTSIELEITENYDAVGLAAVIAKRKHTAVEVATAFCKRAIVVHQLTCCLTQWFMEDAINQARKLDEYLEKNGRPIGPLHGVPISIKEHIHIAGTYSSEGFLASTILDTQDSQMVAILRELGAVFYCKTNQPQMIMSLECTSHHGRTLNPYNIHLTSGGSSGGEAALIAMRGSVLGVGTDIGGSIRTPAAFCGIYGFKPTSHILPNKDFIRHFQPVEFNVQASTGPLCRSLRDMDFFAAALLSMKPHLLDPKLCPMPWTGLSTPVSKPLRIGIIASDGFIEPQPPIRRALEWAKQRLSDPAHADNIQVKDFHPHNAAEAWSKARRMFAPDGGKGAQEVLQASGDPIRPLTEWGWADAAPFGVLSVDELSRLREERDQFQGEFAASWEAQGVDVVIGPAFVGPAAEHDTARYWTYTSLWNLVDYPGVVVPTPLRVDGDEEYEGGVSDSGASGEVKELWEKGDFKGAPLGLQICARRYHDNELFGALAVLKDVLDLA